MQKNLALTPNQQFTGQKRYLWFTAVNAISFSCLAKSVLILYAIKIGANDFLVGFITSLFYLTMPFMFMGKKMVGRIGAAHTYSVSWLLRNISATLMIFAPFLAEYVGLVYGLLLLTLGSFGFFTFRSIGLTANTPIIGEITTKDTRGNFISKIWLYFNLFNLITMIVLIYILRKSSELSIFQYIIAFGSLLGIIASRIVYTVPETKNPQLSGQEPLRDYWKFIWSHVKTKKLVYAWTSVVVTAALVNPFSMVALKNGYLVSDNSALIYALIQSFGAIITALFNSLILDRVGPRPMLIIYVFGMISISILWALAPATYLIPYSALIFLILGMSFAGSMTTVSHYFLSITPENKRVGVNMLIFVISGLSAGISGTFLGGGLLNLLHQFGIESLNIYKIYFLIILAILIPLFLKITNLERVSDWKIKDVLGIFVSIRDVRALFALKKLDRNLNIQQDYLGVERLRSVPSQLSENKLLSYLESPRFSIRGKALGTLGRFNFSDEAAKAIINEVIRGEFTTAYIAAEILGEHKIKESIPVLRKSLDSEDIYLKGKSMVALAQLNDAKSFSKIRKIFNNTINPRIIIHGARAIVEIGQINDLTSLLEKSIDKNIPAQVREELLFSISELCDCNDEFYRFLKSFKNDENLGISILEEILNDYQAESFIDLSEIIHYIHNIKNDDHCDCLSISSFMIERGHNHHVPISSIIEDFLSTHNSHDLFLDLVLCLLLVQAKFELSGHN